MDRDPIEDDTPTGGTNQPDDRSRNRRLPRSAFAYERECLPPEQSKAESINGAKGLESRASLPAAGAFDVKVNVEVVDLKNKRLNHRATRPLAASP